MSATAPAGTSESGLRAANGTRTYRDELRPKLAPGHLVKLAAIAVQFALITLAMALLNLESNAFVQVLWLSLAGFLLNHFLPAAWRWSFFAMLSVASVPLVLGWKSGAWLLGLGGLLIALCHLPIAFRARIALIVMATAAMVAARAGTVPWLSSLIPSPIWPILGSMFMFRLIVYLYDLAHRTAPFGGSRALSYFFMVPNVCFPLFPIVDYGTFQRSAANEDALRLYQTGIRWLARGLVHLTLYRVVYLVGVIDPAEAATGLDAGRYMICTFLLYLKLSGLFHMIVGLLHLYGFGLPETHHLYLLSSSFTDFWRRINIYWKEFIHKIVFNPAYFRLRALGETRALAGATVIAAAMTWFFHACQWFWIRGEFPITAADLIFWGGLGACLTVNVLLEARKGRRRSLGGTTLAPGEKVLLGLKTAGTFSVIVVLWTVWNTPQAAQLEALRRALLQSGPLDLAVLLGVPLVVGTLRVVAGNRAREVSGNRAGSPGAFWREAATVTAIALGLSALATIPSQSLELPRAVTALVEDIRSGRLNRGDLKQLRQGYYEDLGDAMRFNGELWNLYGGRPMTWGWNSSTRPRSDGVEKDYYPSKAEFYKGAWFTTNSLGLRDHEYALEPGPRTFRIALIGSSHDVGAGVNNDETYENIVEERLNRELGPSTGRKFEILNFSGDGYSPTNKLSAVEQRIFRFRPDLVLYSATSIEHPTVFKSVRHIVDNRLLDQFPYVRSALNRAGIGTESSGALPDGAVLERMLAPFEHEAVAEILARFRNGASLRGVRSAVVILEMPDDTPYTRADLDRLRGVARAAGLPVLDLQGAFDGVKDRKSLWIAPWDSHTNAAGHRLLADRLYAQILREGVVPTAPTPAP